MDNITALNILIKASMGDSVAQVNQLDAAIQALGPSLAKSLTASNDVISAYDKKLQSLSRSVAATKITSTTFNDLNQLMSYFNSVGSRSALGNTAQFQAEVDKRIQLLEALARKYELLRLPNLPSFSGTNSSGNFGSLNFRPQPSVDDYTKELWNKYRLYAPAPWQTPTMKPGPYAASIPYGEMPGTLGLTPTTPYSVLPYGVRRNGSRFVSDDAYDATVGTPSMRSSRPRERDSSGRFIPHYYDYELGTPLEETPGYNPNNDPRTYRLRNQSSLFLGSRYNTLPQGSIGDRPYTKATNHPWFQSPWVSRDTYQLNPNYVSPYALDDPDFAPVLPAEERWKTHRAMTTAKILNRARYGLGNPTDEDRAEYKFDSALRNNLTPEGLMTVQSRLTHKMAKLFNAGDQDYKKIEAQLIRVGKLVDELSDKDATPHFKSKDEVRAFIADLQRMKRELEDAGMDTNHIDSQLARAKSGQISVGTGKGSYSRRFNYAAQNVGFAVDDFIQSYQYAGLAGGMRGASNNLTAILASMPMSPIAGAGAIIGASALTAALPMLIEVKDKSELAAERLKTVKDHIDDLIASSNRTIRFDIQLGKQNIAGRSSLKNQVLADLEEAKNEYRLKQEATKMAAGEGPMEDDRTWMERTASKTARWLGTPDDASEEERRWVFEENLKDTAETRREAHSQAFNEELDAKKKLEQVQSEANKLEEASKFDTQIRSAIDEESAVRKRFMSDDRRLMDKTDPYTMKSLTEYERAAREEKNISMGNLKDRLRAGRGSNYQFTEKDRDELTAIEDADREWNSYIDGVRDQATRLKERATQLKEQDTQRATRLQEQLQKVVDPYAAIETDRLARNKEINDNKTISQAEKNKLLGLSDQVADRERANYRGEGQFDKGINHGIDVGSMAEAELKSKLTNQGFQTNSQQQQLADVLTELQKINDNTKDVAANTKKKPATFSGTGSFP